MLDYEASDETLLSFYDLHSLEPKSLADVESKAHPIQVHDLHQVSAEPTDVQFEMLNEVVNRQYEPFMVSRTPADFTAKDAEDPLRGPGSNVIKELVASNAVESPLDPEINHYIVSSQQFDAHRFLTTVHRQSSIDELTNHLSMLDRTIKSQQGEVQRVIDENFERFVNVKQSIDSILTGFKATKHKAGTDRAEQAVYMPGSSVAADDSLSGQLEDSIKNLNTTLSLMIRPIKENRDKEHKLSALVEFVSSQRFLFDLPGRLVANIGKNNHQQVVEDYHSYLKWRSTFDEESASPIVATIANKVCDNVEGIISEYRRRIYRQLLALDHQHTSATFGRAIDSEKNPNARFVQLVDQIYHLDPDKKSNPIAQFLRAQTEGLHSQLEHQLTRFDDRFRTSQQKLGDYIGSLHPGKGGSYVRFIGEKYATVETYFHTNSVANADATVAEVFGSVDSLDLSIVNETWLVLYNFVDYLDDIYRGNLSKFVTNYTHYATQEDVDNDGTIRRSFDQAVTRAVDILVLLFDEERPDTPADASPASYSQFLPHYTNSLSAIYYLSAIHGKLTHFFTAVGSLVAAMGEAYKSSETNKLVKQLRSAAQKVTQRMVEAIGTVWVNDCSQFYSLEQWEVSDIPLDGENAHFDGASYTKLMNIVEYYHGFVLSKLAELVFVTNDSPVRIVGAHPSKKTLVGIEIQFMRCLNITLDSIMKKYNTHRRDDSSAVYKILTMNNFDVLSRLVYPRLIARFDRLFHTDLAQQNLPIFANIDKASLTIFDDVITKQKLVMTAGIAAHFARPDASQMRVDGFIYAILMQFVKLIHLIKPLTGNEIFVSIVNELQQGVLKSILDNLRIHPEMAHMGLANLKLDVNFFMEVFESSKTLKINETAFRIIEILLNTINERLGDQYDQSQWDYVLEENMRVSANQFDCF